MNAARVVVVGLGHQGGTLVAQLEGVGHEIVGAVDIGDKIGRRIADLVDRPVATRATVAEGISAAVVGAGGADVVVLAAAVTGNETLALAREAIVAGCNVVTLHQDFFTPGDWATDLDELARMHGVSFLATGAQDAWFVHLPSALAASSLNVRRVAYTSEVSIDAVSAAVGREVGVGTTREQFEREVAPQLAAHPTVLGEPLREAARRMGATVTSTRVGFEPITLRHDYDWSNAGSVIAAGDVAGYFERVEHDTDLGIVFEGSIGIVPKPVAESADRVRIDGDPVIDVAMQPFPGEAVTNTAVVARIRDIVEAEPGVRFAADLPPMRYQRPA